MPSLQRHRNTCVHTVMVRFDRCLALCARASVPFYDRHTVASDIARSIIVVNREMEANSFTKMILDTCMVQYLLRGCNPSVPAITTHMYRPRRVVLALRNVGL